MKIICAPDSFKESIAAFNTAEAMADGIRRYDQRIAVDLCPVADGGEGTLDAILNARHGAIFQQTVCGPLGEPVEASYGVLDDGVTGVVEMAQASGLALIPRDRRDPTRTSTYGTGQLVRCAVERGCREVVVCIGGSGTVDGGAGIAQALGAQFFDRSGSAIDEPMTGGLLQSVASVIPPDRARLPQLRIACDVTNPLLGKNGAAAVYGPQKGATSDHVRLLDAGLANLARLISADPDIPGFGAAGGAALSLVTLCNAQLERGIEIVLDVLRFAERCADADLVLTGEGSLDSQSLHGKATIGVAKAAARWGVPTIAIVGRVGKGADRCVGPGLLQRYVSISERCGMEAAMNEPARCISDAAEEVCSRADGAVHL